MSGLKWESPPEINSRRRPGKWTTIMEALRTRPGEWAHVHTSDSSSKASSMAANIRLGRIGMDTERGGYEAVSRRVGDEWRVYARYIGGAP